jgi:hypothetical protein
MADTKTVEHDPNVAPSLDDAPSGMLEEGSLDPVYEAKARVLNKAVQDIGMGKYQWEVRIRLSSTTLHANSKRSCSS